MVNNRVVENAVQAKEAVEAFKMEGVDTKNIYIFAHDKDRTDHITDALDAKEVGMKEQGIFDSVSNLFRSRGDELREKMQAVGLSKQEAETYERELDEGKLLIVASNTH